MPELKEQQPLTAAPDEHSNANPPVQETSEDTSPIVRKEYVINGRPQVFEGTPEEVIEKLAEAHQNAASRMNEWRQRAQLDSAEPEVEYKPHQLTPEERYALVNQLSDPYNVDAAYDKLFEARVGVTPDKYREELNRGRKAERENRELQAAMVFMAEHPEYIPCTENRTALNQFFADKKLPVTKNNLEFAYEELRDTLVLNPSQQKHEAAPAASAPPEVAPQSDEAITSDAPNAPTVVTRPRGTATTGLQARHGSSPQARGADTRKQNEQFAQEVARLSAAEYKRLYNSDPLFRGKVDALYSKR